MKRHRVLVFLAAVFAAKAIAVLQLRDHPLVQPGAGLDTTIYTQLASRVEGGDWWLGLLQILLGTAAVGCIYTAAREWFGIRAGWIAAILGALTGLFTFHEVLLDARRVPCSCSRRRWPRRFSTGRSGPRRARPSRGRTWAWRSR